MFPRVSRRRSARPSVAPDDWIAAADKAADRDALLMSASRACCCSARPAVVALMPPTRYRPHRTDLLLCGHHYRMSGQALAAAGAVVLDPDSPPAAAQLAPARKGA
jgi:hypothetical protein